MKWIESLKFEHLSVEERRTVKNGGKSSQICSRKLLRSVTEALRLDSSSWKRVFLPKKAKMHSLGVMNIFETAPPPLFIGKKGGACRPEASWGRFLSAPQLLSSPPFSYFTEKSRKSYGNVSDLIFTFFFSPLSPILSEICLPKVFGNFTEALRKPRKPFFNKTWRSLPPNCFLLKQPNLQNVLEGPRFEFLFTPLSW